MSVDRSRILSILESLIFVSEKPLSFRKIRAILDGVPAKDLQAMIEELSRQYREQSRGIILEEVAEGYQMRTPPENQDWIKMLVEYKPMRLSRPAMETLAIIAYRQPVTKTDVESIRGVDSTSGVARLLELGLIKILGRKEIPGRPFIYGTTPDFLEVFNLATLADLPSLKEIEDLNPGEIEAFTDKLSQAAGAKVESAPETEDNTPGELLDLEQVGQDAAAPVESEDVDLLLPPEKTKKSADPNAESRGPEDEEEDEIGDEDEEYDEDEEGEYDEDEEGDDEEEYDEDEEGDEVPLDDDGIPAEDEEPGDDEFDENGSK